MWVEVNVLSLFLNGKRPPSRGLIWSEAKSWVFDNWPLDRGWKGGEI